MLFAIPLFIALGIILPLLGWVILRHAHADTEDQNEVPSVRAIAAQLAILQTIVGCLALLAGYGVGLELAWLSELSLVTLPQRCRIT